MNGLSWIVPGKVAVVSREWHEAGGATGLNPSLFLSVTADGCLAQRIDPESGRMEMACVYIEERSSVSGSPLFSEGPGSLGAWLLWEDARPVVVCRFMDEDDDDARAESVAFALVSALGLEAERPDGGISEGLCSLVEDVFEEGR